MNATSETPRVNRRQQFGALLWHLAEMTRATETRRSFRAKAYRRAMWSLDSLSTDLSESKEEMLQVDGIGPGIARLIAEFQERSSIENLERLRKEYPTESRSLGRLPRMTPKLLRALKQELGVDTAEDMIGVVHAEGPLDISGVGPATLDLWERTLAEYSSNHGFPAHQAWVFASELARHLKHHVEAEVSLTGEVRRVTDWALGVDLVMVPEDREAARNFLLNTALALETEQGPDSIVLRTHEGIPAAVHLTHRAGIGTTQLITTGPPLHVGKVLGTNTNTDFPTEAEAYRSAGLAWIPPAARALPIEAAQEVVATDHIRGDLHIHSSRSPDGRLALREIVELATKLEYDYIAITDHTHGLRFGGMGPDEVKRQAEEIALMREEFSEIHIFHGAELNIERDGTLDLDETTLEILDFAVAGLHSHFGLDEPEQTERILRALDQKKVRVLAHPTGRRIGIRPPIDVDIDAVIEAAIAQEVALELNGHRDRLDLQRDLARRAARMGARFALNSDAHRTNEFLNMTNALAIAQSVGLKPSQIVNAMDLGDFTRWANP